MASEGTELSTRMSTEDQGIDDSFIYNTIFKHFKRNKVEISRAINKEFPFFEILRDHELITSKMYKDCQKSCRNRVPVQIVVYNMLEELEKTFNPRVWQALFSEANKQEYPDLNNIYEVFENAINEHTCFQENDGEESVENPNTQLSLEQGTSPPENGLSEHHRERGQTNVNETVTTSNNNDALESQQANEQCAQEAESAVIISDEDESPKASTSEQRRRPEPLDLRTLCRKRPWETVRNRGRNRIQSLNNRVPRKRSKPKRTKAVNTRPLKRSRKRGPRIPRDKQMNFKCSILPVTCGPAEGMLYKEKMKQGISAKCIETKNGKQLTLKEFEIEGQYERSKNWRLTVRCDGYPLIFLIKKGFLPDPPRARKIIPDSHSDNIIYPYPENSNICEMCHKGGTLFCYDTCPRSFHDSCHIHHIDPDRVPWSCIFCEIKIILKRCPESQPCHQESEILERKMLHEEHLSKKRSQSLTKYECLNKVSEKVASKLYLQVKEFVQDMCLIFQNHRKIYEGQKFIMLGIEIEAKFEKNFKDIFGIQ